MVGIGGSHNIYEEPLQSIWQTASKDPNVTRVQIHLNLLGIYAPLKNKHTILGGSMTGTADALNFGNLFIQLNLYQYGFSMLHFFGKEPGDGFFLRGDLALSRAVLMDNVSIVASPWGYGGLVGMGYGLPISKGTRLLFTLKYLLSSLPDEGQNLLYQTIALDLSLLW